MSTGAMIKVTILYPKNTDGTFDFDHYLSVHMPLAIARLGDAMEEIRVERPISPGAPWPDPPFAAICSFVCRSREEFERAFLPHMEELQADISNYTNIQQIVVISEIEIDRRAR
ncbi:MAG TPA: EthD family reductase [Sphingomicrobium sp.]|nr:EthD family reductase [Sphingomicrobium sp.]